MSPCPRCAAPLPQESRYCLRCGTDLSLSQSPTRVETAGAGDPCGAGDAPGPRPDPVPGHSATPLIKPSGSGLAGRRSTSRGAASGPDAPLFEPGEILAERYRVVGRLGRGGMGDVYRADDLILDHPVALKFLPDALARDPARVDRFLDEVRVARQVSHANVCRVYDIGEVHHRLFLSMEYIDGEDLASLLRRIGRLPGDKAIEITRQICAGLAAAHERGVIHRDLKPANIMIDGQGRARIADFGLAALADTLNVEDIRSGTPLYMAPEQLVGREVTVQSDLYALGLVLYEVFTGKRAFEAKTLQELARAHSGSTAVPSTHVPDLDAAVERVILQCLEADPRLRPSSALAVAAALPGGDPLAAALAAGETPSPEVVAAAGGAGIVSSRWAWTALIATLSGLAVLGVLLGQTSLLAHAPLEKPPEVLAERARSVLTRLGYSEPAADSAYRYALGIESLRWIERNDPSPGRWSRLRSHRPSPHSFWYRESPRPLEPSQGDGMVWFFDPPPLVSGMTFLQLDTLGRLTLFLAVPPQIETTAETAEPTVEPGSGRMSEGSTHAAVEASGGRNFENSATRRAEAVWSSAFEEAGLDQSAFLAVPSRWTPLVYADARRAWEGTISDSRANPVRVEAASYHGRPVYFEVVGPWDRAVRMQPFVKPGGLRVGETLNAIFVGIVLLVAAVLIWRNLKLGLCDRRGAFRIALFLFLLCMLRWLLRADHLRALDREWDLFCDAAADSLFVSGFLWMLYMALEPFIRRRWPQSIISWNRLVSGRFRDPLIGRDILAGATLGTALALTGPLYHLTHRWLSLPLPIPTQPGLGKLLGVRFLGAGILDSVLGAVLTGMLMLFFLFMGIGPMTRRWPGIMIFLAISTMMHFLFLGEGTTTLKLMAAFARSALMVTLLVRFGLLAGIIGSVFALWDVPLTFDLSTWYAGTSIMGWVPLVILSLLGFYTAGRTSGLRRGGRHTGPPHGKTRRRLTAIAEGAPSPRPTQVALTPRDPPRPRRVCWAPRKAPVRRSFLLIRLWRCAIESAFAASGDRQSPWAAPPAATAESACTDGSSAHLGLLNPPGSVPTDGDY